MKYLLLLLIVVAVIWLMRLGRAGSAQKDTRNTATPAGRKAGVSLQQMVVCAHCGVHLPRNEALPGPGERLYCSEAHRQLHNRSAGEGKA